MLTGIFAILSAFALTGNFAGPTHVRAATTPEQAPVTVSVTYNQNREAGCCERHSESHEHNGNHEHGCCEHHDSHEHFDRDRHECWDCGEHHHQDCDREWSREHDSDRWWRCD
jgi:hypothetical protein